MAGLKIDLPRLLETRLLIQAQSGQGKSWCLRWLLEQTHGQVQQLVARCDRCTYWNHHPDANLPYRIGECTAISTLVNTPEPGGAIAGLLLTADTFFCASFQRKPKSDPRREDQ